MEAIGVDLIIDLMDFNTVAEKTMDADPAERPKNFDVYTMGFSLSVDPDLKGALFDADAGEKGGFNASGFRDEHVQELIAKGRTTFDQAERVKIYAELAKILNDEVATAIVRTAMNSGPLTTGSRISTSAPTSSGQRLSTTLS